VAVQGLSPSQMMRAVEAPGTASRGKARAAVGGSTPPLSVSSGRRATGFEEGTAGSPGKLVPITRDFLHYLEPSPHAVKRKNREAGSKFGRYRNRFHKSPDLKMGEVLPSSEEPAHVLYPHE
jgi:hypothetical protein